MAEYHPWLPNPDDRPEFDPSLDDEYQRWVIRDEERKKKARWAEKIHQDCFIGKDNKILPHLTPH